MNRLKALFAVAALMVVSASFIATPAQAGEYDNDMYRGLMQKCGDIHGTLVAKYPSGWHWIVSFSPNQWGADKVKNVGYDNYIQCFCPRKLEGFEPLFRHGVQTNWLKASNVSNETQQKLLSQDWLWVNNGADFGLAPEPYLAKNIKWDCPDCK